jgi:hypothetical protein
MEARQLRASAAAALAVLLVGLIALVAIVGNGENAVVMLQMLKTHDSADSTAASTVALQAQLKTLKKNFGKETTFASKGLAKVDKAELAQKKTLLTAKGLMVAGMQDERMAKTDVEQASSLRTKAQKLRDESEAARREFVEQEHPVLLAQKLAQHDHKIYRSDELRVAKEVALLSEKPSSKALRAQVDKLVKKSKDAKNRMEEDGMLLKKLEKRTADAQMGGAQGYSELKQKSVKIAKKAEGIAEQAVKLAKKGHAEKSKGRADLKEVEAKLKKPDHEYAVVKLVEQKSAKTHKVIQALQSKIEKEEVKEDETEEVKHKKAKKKEETDYSKERKALEEEVEGKSAKKAVKPHMSNEQKQLEAAKDSYDKLEELEEKKEKARLHREEKREGKTSEKTAVKNSDPAMSDQVLKHPTHTHIPPPHTHTRTPSMMSMINLRTDRLGFVCIYSI